MKKFLSFVLCFSLIVISLANLFTTSFLFQGSWNGLGFLLFKPIFLPLSILLLYLFLFLKIPKYQKFIFILVLFQLLDMTIIAYQFEIFYNAPVRVLLFWLIAVLLFIFAMVQIFKRLQKNH